MISNVELQVCIYRLFPPILMIFMKLCTCFLFYPITLEGNSGIIDDLATSAFHLVLFSSALIELAKSISVHSLIVSCHLFFSFFYLFPVGSSLLSQRTLRRGQTILVSVSLPRSEVHQIFKWLLGSFCEPPRWSLYEIVQ